MENNFDPNAAAVADSGIYGLPCTAEEAQIIIIPVEWELTTSYNRGTVDGPATIMEASLQVDLCHHDYPDLWQKGIWMDEFPKELRELHDENHGNYTKVPMLGNTRLYFCSPTYGHADYNKVRTCNIEGNEAFCNKVIDLGERIFAKKSA